ncbi:MAG: type IV pilin N-terminal domain-containing protein [Methanimicrococcus sp.]|nr:type IV pilin N-terminal domain-containing protein [Methanimicrococcus sp.]MCL2141451.1 type IV pilin N-terminal domain-containing protein [Methanimicrococcus sp.]
MIQKSTTKGKKTKNNFLSDQKAVSQVVSVLLLLAITVIMAGFLAAEVLSFEFTAPSKPVSLSARVEKITDGTSTYAAIRLEHTGGAPLDTSNLRILVNQSEADLSYFPNDLFSIGESVLLCGIENNKMAVLQYPIGQSSKKPTRNILNTGEAVEVIVIDTATNQILFKKTVRSSN